MAETAERVTIVSSTALAAQRRSAQPERVGFERVELATLLGMYGRMVAAGEWRDFAIDMLIDRAVFSVFRRSSEMPLYRIEKDPRLARKQGMYSVVSAAGFVVKRGHDLKRVLRVFDKSSKVVEL